MPLRGEGALPLFGIPAENGQGQTPNPLAGGLLSLFCGAGGLDEGFRQRGFATEVAVDSDPVAVETFAHNHPNARVVQADVANLTLTDLDRYLGKECNPLGVLGGPPCQSFSSSNIFQRSSDPRHHLPEHYASLLKKLNERSPVSFFVFENVPGLLGKKHVGRYTYFKKLFREAGFDVYERLLNAKDFGVPQDRSRIFIIGINTRKHPRAVWIPPRPVKGFTTVRKAIEGLEEPVFNAANLDPLMFPEHPNHWCLVPRSSKFGSERRETHRVLGRSFRKLAWDKPSWTVAYGHREVHLHPEGHRRLSIYEAMRLQSFPKSYRLLGHMSDQVRLVSDAVPPVLARHLADSIVASLLSAG